MVLVTPDQFPNMACPTYPEIRLALAGASQIGRRIEAAQPCAIHIATEGPLGWAARRFCLGRNLPFSTAYHTRFPEYVHARFRLPLRLTYAVMRRFHAPAAAVMVATASIQAELEGRGFRNIRRWSRGVDTKLFRPRPGERPEDLPELPRPVFLYVGRVAVEKNIQAFLDLDLPGSKLVVGDGPQLQALRKAYPRVHFAGARHGEDLARHYAVADAFVFPSLTDTFGLVLLEALAAGVPVAAFPVAGPLDVVGEAPVGRLDADLRAAALAALAVPRDHCREYALGFSWRASTEQFLSNLRHFGQSAWYAAA